MRWPGCGGMRELAGGSGLQPPGRGGSPGAGSCWGRAAGRGTCQGRPEAPPGFGALARRDCERGAVRAPGHGECGAVAAEGRERGTRGQRGDEREAGMRREWGCAGARDARGAGMRGEHGAGGGGLDDTRREGLPGVRGRRAPSPKAGQRGITKGGGPAARPAPAVSPGERRPPPPLPTAVFLFGVFGTLDAGKKQSGREVV